MPPPRFMASVVASAIIVRPRNPASTPNVIGAAVRLELRP